MKKLLSLLVALLFVSLGASAQWLYRVSGDSLSAPSYIVASHELINPLGIVSKIDSLTMAMTNTQQLCLPVYRTPYASSIADAKKLPAGKTLSALLTPAQTSLLDNFLKKYTEVGWKSAYNQRRYNDKMPLAVQEELTKLLFVANHIGDYDPTHTFDGYFEAQAKANGDPIIGLMPIDNYLNRYQKTALDKQVAAFVSFLENEQSEQKAIDKVVDAYNAKDMDAVAAATAQHCEGSCCASKADKVVEVMKQKPTLFVLPCQWLGGANGLLSSLKAKGLAVVPMP
jgi:uncharacterized protein YbaP (TraB family)